MASHSFHPGTNVKLSKIIFVAVLLLLLNRYLPIYQAFIRAGNKVIGIPIEATVNGLFYNKELFKTEGKTMLPDREAAKRALTFFRSLIEAKLVPTSSWPGKTDSAPLFKTGVTALMWSGNWQLKTLVEGGTRFPFGTTYFPKDAIRTACPGGEFFYGLQELAESRRCSKGVALVGRTVDNKELSRKPWGLTVESDERSAGQLREVYGLPEADA